MAFTLCLSSVVAEIDRCLKKITEGVETFDDIWQKVVILLNTKFEYNVIVYFAIIIYKSFIVLVLVLY
jgi:hypothetical protein